MADITVVGSFVMDSVARMERFPGAGESVIGTSVQSFAGGKGINQCVSVARLGGNVQMIGMLGSDANGDIFRRIMAEEGIGSEYVFSCDLPTGTAQIQINADGENRICVIPSANHAFGFEHLDRIGEKLKKSRLLMLQLELRTDVTKELIRRAKEYGVPVLLNPAPAIGLDAETLAKVDYLTPNETELAILSGMPADTDEQAERAARKLLSLGARNVVATLGSRGALIVNASECRTVPAFPATVKDTVAAGDSFNGALAVAITEGKSLPEAVRFANAMGALTVGVEGAIPSLHTRAQVERFLREYEN